MKYFQNYKKDMSKINIGQWIIFLGIGLIALGSLIWILTKLGIPFGRFPGDIAIKGEKYQFHFPLMTSILISLLLTIVLNVVFWIFKR